MFVTLKVLVGMLPETISAQIIGRVKRIKMINGNTVSYFPIHHVITKSLQESFSCLVAIAAIMNGIT